MRRTTSFVILTCLVISVLVGSACMQRDDVAEISKETATEILAQTQKEKPIATPDESPKPAETTPKSPATAVEKRVYLDASKSMRGFAGHGGNFDRLLGELGYLMGDPKVYKFGSRTKDSALRYSELVQPTQLGQEQRSPDYYDLIHNPDDVLFSELSQRGRETLSVYISDGVYSAADARAGSKVITPLSQWFGKGRVLGIFALQSPFKGSFYSEKSCSETRGQRCWLEQVNVGKRPFYVFVFSPDEDTFRKLQTDMKSKFKDLITLTFLDHSITSDGLGLPENDSIYDSGKQADGYYWQMFTSKLFDADGPPTLHFDLRYVIDQEYPLKKLSCRVSAKYYAWDNTNRRFAAGELPSTFKSLRAGNRNGVEPRSNYERAQYQLATANIPAMAFMGQGPTRQKPRSQPEKSAEADATSSATKPTASPGSPSRADQSPIQSTGFDVQIPRDNRTTYSLYYLPIAVDVDEISASVQKLSTDDDSLPQNANLTYRFAEMIRALLVVHVESRLANQLAPPLFLTISN